MALTRKSGAIALFVLIAFGFVAVLLMFFGRTQQAQRRSLDFYQNQAAYYAAEGGLQKALLEVEKGRVAEKLRKTGRLGKGLYSASSPVAPNSGLLGLDELIIRPVL